LFLLEEYYKIYCPSVARCELFLAINYAEFLGVFVLAPKPTAPAAPSTVPGCNQIFCCAFNADGSIFVTGSSDKIARVIMLTLLVIQKYLPRRLSD
jgi:hypothetical protein